MARRFDLVPFAALFAVAAAAACSSSESDPRGTEDQNVTGGSTAEATLSPLMALSVGEYTFDFHLTRDPSRGILTGHFAAAVGDPRLGGATSEFYFITDEKHRTDASYRLVWFNSDDGAPRSGTLEIPTRRAITLKLDSEPLAFHRVCGGCGDPVRGAELKFVRAGDPRVGSHAMRRIKSAEAHFSDAPGGRARAAFVLANQFVGIQEIKGSSSLATFRGFFDASETRGYIDESDLVALDDDLRH